jgi:hypothetical protein
MTTTKNAVQDAMDAAKAARDSQPKVPATTSANTNVEAYVQPRQLSLDDLQGSGLDVDGFIQVKADGFKLKMSDENAPKDTGFIESFHVSIDIDKIAIFECIKYGDPTVYIKTYGQGVTASGGSWTDAVRKAQAADPAAKPYQGGDVPMTLLADAVDFKNKVVAKAGQTIGHSTPVTGRKNLKDFIDAVTKAGLRGTIVEAVCTVEKRSKPGGQEWGVVKFQLIGEHNPEA